MRFRRVIFAITALVAVALLGFVMLKPRDVAVPEVRLKRLLRMQLETLYDSGSPVTAFFGTPFPGEETLEAEFEIRAPHGNGMVLTNGVIGIEALSADGQWTRRGEDRSYDALRWAPVSIQIQRRLVRVPITVPLKVCRFTIGFRPPTLRERCQRILQQSGVWRRFPRASLWIWRRFPATERWVVCQLWAPADTTPMQAEVQKVTRVIH